MIKCKLCGRVFDAPQPHNCDTGFRKRRFQWEEIPEVLEQKINTILIELDQYARDYDAYEYGLPMHDEHIEEMREIIRKCL